MITKIQGEAPFQVLATNFSISPSEQDYTLQVSADGENFSDLFTVSAGQTKMVTNVANGSYYRLKNNNSLVEVNWRTQCNDGQGGGGGGTGPQGPQGPQGPAGAGDSGQVQTMIDNSLASFSQGLQDGEPIVGMAAQLYSPDGVTSEGTYAYRTTAGDADVNTGDAELRTLKGNSDYSEVETTYNDSAVLMRNGEEVEGFDADFYWGDSTAWVDYSTGQVMEAAEPQAVRLKPATGSSRTTTCYFNMKVEGFSTSVAFSYQSNNTWLPYSKVSATTTNNWVWGAGEFYGTAVWDGEYLTLTADENAVGYFISFQNDGAVPIARQYMTGSIVPNDIPFGESTYTYGIDGWSPELPQAVSAMALNGSTYEPSLDDELVITRSISASGSAIYPVPSEFVALGLNSFDYTCEGVLSSKEEGLRVYYDSYHSITNYSNYEDNEDYTTFYVKAVTGLADGYVLHSPNGVLTGRAGVVDIPDFYHSEDPNYGDTIEVSANTTYVVYPTTAMPYIIFSVLNGDETDVCVHPRWSGKMDDAFEEYSESVVDLSTITNDYPLYSVGNYRNEIDLKNGVFKEWIMADSFDSEMLAEYLDGGRVLGVDIAYDEEYIYLAQNEPMESSISVDYAYKDNDFSVEYFVAYDDEDNAVILPQPVYAETYYITNLVDKLRRMENNFIHLDSPDTAGETGKTYEYQGRLMQWVEGSGYTAEWLGGGLYGTNQGNGFIFAVIPEGQKLFDYGYYNNEKSSVYYRNGKLVDVTSGGTQRHSVSVGSTFDWNPYNNTGTHLYGIYKNGYIGLRANNSLIRFENVWSGRVGDSHYELIDKYNYPYTAEGSGIPQWNEKGQVINNNTSVSTKNIYINTTATTSSSRTTVLTNGTNNGPDRWFAPTAGGTQGQMLVSAGANAAPTWIDWIKVVKITSDAYEALVQAGTTDPNTLYAIVDE